MSPLLDDRDGGTYSITSHMQKQSSRKSKTATNDDLNRPDPRTQIHTDYNLKCHPTALYL